MRRLALHDAPQHNDGMWAYCSGAVQERFDRDRRLPSAGDPYDLDIDGAASIELIQRPLQKLFRDKFVPAAYHDGESLSTGSHATRYRVHTKSMARFASFREPYLEGLDAPEASAPIDLRKASLCAGSNPYHTRRTTP